MKSTKNRDRNITHRAAKHLARRTDRKIFECLYHGRTEKFEKSQLNQDTGAEKCTGIPYLLLERSLRNERKQQQSIHV